MKKSLVEIHSNVVYVSFYPNAIFIFICDYLYLLIPDAKAHKLPQ